MGKSEDSDLERAVTSGDEAYARHCLSVGADPNFKNSMGYTMAAWCVVCNSGVEMLKVLKEGGADLMAKCESGLTPAELAVAFCRPEMLGFIGANADLDVRRDLSGRGVTLRDFPSSPASSKMSFQLQEMLNSLRVGSEIEDAMGPLEGAFSAPLTMPQRSKGMSPL